MKMDLEDVLPLLSGTREYLDYYTAVCPFHEDSNPSLIVNKEGWFRCFGCGATGNFDKLHRTLVGHRPVRSPVESQTQWVSPILPPFRNLDKVSDLATEAHHTLVDNDHLAWYLEQRGLEDRIEVCRLGWYDGWYTVPIFSAGGALLGLVTRASPLVQEASNVRFGQPKGQPAMLYIPDHNLMKKADTLFVTYGIFDALSISSLRFAACTPTAGKLSLQVKWFEGWKGNIVMVPDKGEDDTARRFAATLSSSYPARKIKILELEYENGLRDINDYFQAGQRKALMSQLVSVA